MAAQQCVMTACAADCRAEASFACLSPAGVMPTPMDDELRQRLTFVDLASEAPLAGVRVRACTRVGWADPSCSRSLDAEGTSDGQGAVTLEVPYPLLGVKRPWDGYFFATGPSTVSDLRVFSTPRTNDFAYRHRLSSRETHEALLAALGVSPRPDHGDLSVNVYDCRLAPAAGIELELVPHPEGVRRVYFRGSLPLDEAARTTEANGRALFVDVPLGRPLTLRATVAATGAVLNELEVLVLPGVVTTVELEPRVEGQ
jgi:hypothetical protein